MLARITLVIMLVGLTGILQPTRLFAAEDDDAVSNDAVANEAAYQELVRQAQDYEFEVGGQPLTLRPQPLLSWSNPARRGEDGLVFLWSLNEKPVVVGTCFTYVYKEETRRKHAFAALGNDPVTSRHRGRIVWQPNKDALVFAPITNRAPLGVTPTQRTTQLRQIARRFSVTLTSKDGRTEQCRLVPQPLLRFDGEGDSGECGAVFSFAVGTDPEALLMIQRRQDSTGTPQWHYAFLRFTYYSLEGFLDEISVWSPGELENMVQSILTRPDYQREAYVTFRPEWLD